MRSIYLLGKLDYVQWMSNSEDYGIMFYRKELVDNVGVKWITRIVAFTLLYIILLAMKWIEIKRLVRFDCVGYSKIKRKKFDCVGCI